MKISIFSEVINKKKLKFVNKIFSFLYENNEDIKINKYISQKYINKLYQPYNELFWDKKYDALKKIIILESNEKKGN